MKNSIKLVRQELDDYLRTSKMNKRTVIANLNKIANELDNSGMFDEATDLTNVMHKVAQMASPIGPVAPYQPQPVAAAPVGGAMGQMAANPNANLTALTGVGLTPRQLLQAQQQAQQAQQQQAQQQKQEFGQNAQAIINGMSPQYGGDINKMIQALNQYLRQGMIGQKLHNDAMYILNMRRQPAQQAVAQQPGAPAPSPTMGVA
jgi:flagellin-specific chaperone FliS